MKVYKDNNTSGEIHIILDTSDVGDSPTGVQHDLKVWLGGDSMGEDESPTMWLVVNDSRDRHTRVTEGESDCMFSVSTARLRQLCDMIDAMHAVGLQQWDANAEVVHER